MKEIRISTENKLSIIEVLKSLNEVKNNKAKIFLGCPVLDYSTAVIRRYNKHYFLIDYTERNFWRYAYLCNITQAIGVIMQGIGSYEGISIRRGLIHPSEKDRYTKTEVLEGLRDFFYECKERLSEYIYFKCSTVKPKTEKQLVLF
jgi:hypothetical protein